MYAGYVTLAYFWAAIADASYRALEEGTEEKAYYEGKIKTARFYYKRLLPKANSHKELMLSGAKNLMDLKIDEF